MRIPMTASVKATKQVLITKCVMTMPLGSKYFVPNRCVISSGLGASMMLSSSLLSFEISSPSLL